MYNSQTPIDIHCSKIVDWLVQRRHCKKNWGESLTLIRRKIKAALQDMPENDEIKQLLIGSKLDYFKSKRIVEILKTTEENTKNFFGYYSSQRMKDWQDIVYSYEKDCVFIAEVATDLIRETNYEVPSTRKAIGKLNRVKDELEEEKSNLLRKAKQFTSEYQKLAQSYGINGQNIERELSDESKNLVIVMDQIVELSRALRPDLEAYRRLSKSTTKMDSSEFLPMLHYIITRGNTTVYEWRHGQAPEGIISPKEIDSGASNPSDTDVLDDEIDFGEDLPSSESSSGFVHVDKSDNVQSNVDESFINVEAENDKIARGDDAKLILKFRKTRDQYINNIHELKSFLDQLSSNWADLSSTGTFVSESSNAVQDYSLEEIEAALTKARTILMIVNQDKNKTLFQLSDSPIFLENIKEKFATKLKMASECNVKAELLEDQIKDAVSRTRETEIHLKRSTQLARELQRCVESSLRDLYGGRPINIMGCVG